MKSMKGLMWVVLVVAGFLALVVSCRRIPKDTTDPDWQYRHRYKSLRPLMGKMQGHRYHLKKAKDRPDYMAKHAGDLEWDAEVIAALAPQIKVLAKEPRASNINYLSYASSVEAGARQARASMLVGNWRRAKFHIEKMNDLGCKACHIDFRDK